MSAHSSNQIGPDRDAELQTVAATFGTPAYVYFTDVLAARLARLKAAFAGRFDISYAVKSNPNPALLGWMRDRLETLDISSGGELSLAQRAGWPPERISFTGPAKRESELRAAISAGIGELVLESLREARLANQIALAIGKVQPVLLRLGPDRVPKGFGDQMAGRPSPFGIDIEAAPEVIPETLSLPGLRVIGLHIYSGTQSLKADAICENWRGFITIFREICARYDLTPERLIFGAGLGIPYHPGDQELDLEAIAEVINPDLDALKTDPRFGETRLALELGRYLTGPAGVFLTQVLATKHSRGRDIALCDGGLNANLAATGNFGMVLRRNYILRRVGGDDAGSRPIGPVDIAGPLCTSIDRLGTGVELPRLDEGDLVVIQNCGAYGPSASPINFISHPWPNEVLVTETGMQDANWLGQQPER
ncbi:type III PLP-dependent enzyme [Paracoccus aminophilus]|uniref:Diaminopimelate decarboxylase n=1 Tax=Paracoccus aminophilus JCM 7686 TaxID=1367847 RepID=S5Z0X4_PARAH|nr:type III PLP-dependent enzyme [Paracoccus aminophilus]AGT11071.1 diaminopimelate decarboxylase [Paracoccus aminophilus JCM 7686]